MKLGTIDQEAKLCRKAFAKTKIGDMAWCCHHTVLFEKLTELPEERIKFILQNKPKKEQARRLREFRPVLTKLIDDEYRAKLKSIDDEYLAKLKLIDDGMKILHKKEYPDTKWKNGTIFNK